MPLVVVVRTLGARGLFCRTILYYKTSNVESQNEFRWNRDQGGDDRVCNRPA